MHRRNRIDVRRDVHTVMSNRSSVNSRPLCAISTDPNDVSILTPGHFLMGSAPLAPPEESYLESKVNWLNRWQLIQKMTQQFWSKWQTEYLGQLQQRVKWFNKEPEININVSYSFEMKVHPYANGH